MRIFIFWVVYRMVILVTRVIEMHVSTYTQNAKTYRVPTFSNMSMKFFVIRHALCNFRDNDIKNTNSHLKYSDPLDTL